MDAFLTRRYERWGAWYLVPFIVIPGFNAVLGVAIGVFAVTSFVSATTSQIASATLASLLASALALCLTFALVVPDGRRLIRWQSLRGAAAAPEVWHATARFPARVIVIGVCSFSAMFVPVILWGRPVLHLSWSSGLPLYLAIEVAILFSATLDYFAVELLIRPLRRSAAAYLPVDFQPEHNPVTLRSKMFAVVLVVGLSTSVLVASAETGISSPGDRLTAGVAVALGVVAVVGLLPASLLAQLELLSSRELTRATGQVAGGDLSAAIPLVAADETAVIVVGFNRMLLGLKERGALHAAMGSYVDPVIAERVLSEGARLTGEAADVTIMFIDIVGFTTLAEDALPEEVVSDLNDFFEIVVPVIERHGGHANKLLGDGLMAVFGVPVRLDDHADQALAAAREIDRRLGEHYAGHLRAGIGLNSGTVVVGSMGGGRKLDYTVIGDAVNVAARVEAFTRQTGDSILITEATRLALSPSHRAPGFQPRGSVALKGRQREIALHAVCPSAAHAPSLPSRRSECSPRTLGCARLADTRRLSHGGSRVRRTWRTRCARRSVRILPTERSMAH